MRKAISIILCVLIWLTLCRAPVWAVSAEEVNTWIENALQEPSPDKKIELYQKVLEVDPQNAEVHNNLGILYKQKENLKQAEYHYKAALASPNYRTPEFAYYNLGVLYKDQSRYKEAIPFFEQAINISPDFDKAYNGLGLCYKALGNYEDAIQAFKNALKINPDNVQANYNLTNIWRLPAGATSQKSESERLYDEGVALLAVDKPEAAYNALAEAVKLDPKHYNAKEKLDAVKSMLEFKKLRAEAENVIAQYRWGDAEALLTKAAKTAVSPADKEEVNRLRREMEAKVNRGRIQKELGQLFVQGQATLSRKDWLGAISQFTKILMLEPENKAAQGFLAQAKAEHYYEKGMQAMENKNFMEADKHFTEALNSQPEHPGARAQMKILAAMQDKKSVDTLVSLAAKSFKEGNIVDARNKYAAALQMDPNNAAARAGVGKIDAIPVDNEHSVMGSIRVPIYLFSLLIGVLGLYLILIKAARPGNIIDHYRKLKDFDKARLVYENILNKDSDRREVYAPLSALYLKLKKPEGIDFLVNSCQQKLADTSRTDLPYWRLCLGEIYREIGQIHEAQEQMEDAREHLPGDREISSKLASLYEAVLEKNPDDQEIKLRLKKIEQSTADVATIACNMPAPLAAPAPADDDHALQVLRECFGREKQA